MFGHTYVSAAFTDALATARSDETALLRRRAQPVHTLPFQGVAVQRARRRSSTSIESRSHAGTIEARAFQKGPGQARAKTEEKRRVANISPPDLRHFFAGSDDTTASHNGKSRREAKTNATCMRHTGRLSSYGDIRGVYMTNRPRVTKSSASSEAFS